ncbi:MAG: hypothetical protein U1F50_20150 [Rubrivivax sp.]
MAEARGWPAVLMNPAVDPARDLAPFVGARLGAFHTPNSASRSAPNTWNNCAR